MALRKTSMKSKAAATSKTARKVPVEVMKAKQRKRRSKVARGRVAKAMVFSGAREKTAGGLTKDGLVRNKEGRLVSKRRNALGRQKYHQVEDWVKAVVQARQAVHATGFVAVNGKTVLGKAIYLKAKSILEERRRAAGAAAAPRRERIKVEERRRGVGAAAAARQLGLIKVED
uniref:Uncharacterized protein n=1 Tax=Alexandrium catenella TaxID=2925 RepID=A0A7S1LYR9_ALECA|mmetsp:Transcript_16654/g.45204  ORF Transcript_16654/g.45204 Transcript_16654/m.45204 type:complete len:173 (+) Transcript_16654:105-623(+)